MTLGMVHQTTPATIGRVTCSYCRKVTEPSQDPAAPTSHGICADCCSLDVRDLDLLARSWHATQQFHAAFAGER